MTRSLIAKSSKFFKRLERDSDLTSLRTLDNMAESNDVIYRSRTQDSTREAALKHGRAQSLTIGKDILSDIGYQSR